MSSSDRFWRRPLFGLFSLAWAWFCGLLLIPGALLAESVSDVVSYRDSATGLVIVAGNVRLPSAGEWQLDSNPASSALVDIALLPPSQIQERSKGLRALQQLDQRDRQTARGSIYQIYHAVSRYARDHEGLSPPTIDQLDARDLKRIGPDKRADFYLIPNATLFLREKQAWRNVTPPQPVAFELAPVVDDGKHWVVMSNGAVELKAVDPQLLATHGVEVIAKRPTAKKRLEQVPSMVDYRLYARRRPVDDPQGVVKLSLVNGMDRLQVSWPHTAPELGDRSLLEAWGAERIKGWHRMDQGIGVSLLTHWSSIASHQYGIEQPPQSGQRRRGNGRQAGLFQVLGGRAAIRETLQLQAIGGGNGKKREQRDTPIESIPGVQVKSHPFEQMLDGSEGGTLGLADLVPPDRFFAYFAKPEALLGFLDGGSKFVYQSGAAVTGSRENYDLKRRYLNAMGMDEAWMRRLLSTGVVKELAVLLPDLFLREGTDMTALVRLAKPKLAAPLLRLVGLIESGKINEQQNVDGSRSYWLLQDDLLLISTRQSELARVRALIKDPTQPTLGRSHEFRYMLTRLPLGEQTQSYFYFSDPFIRRLVGPEVKIAQLRRLKAGAELEAMTAAALLYQLDGHGTTTDIEELVRRGYARAPILVTDMVLDEKAISRSATYGSSGRLNTLLQNPVRQVTNDEARAYKTYLQGYNRFWRRFFDPIAIRLDGLPGGELEVETFILPLIENSIYQALREGLGDHDRPLKLPQLETEPVAMLSLQLSDEVMDGLLGEYGKLMAGFVGADSSILDHLGPDLHLALGDADPIISAGSGELAGLFGMAGGRFNSSRFVGLPLFVSLLTRPTMLLIGLDEPQVVLDKLRRAPTGPIRDRSIMGFANGSLYKMQDRDAWRYTISLGGLLKMRLGLSVKDRYLVIANQPLSYDPDVTGVVPAHNRAAAMHLAPGAGERQLPALFESATEAQRTAAMAGGADIYPLMLLGAKDVPAALVRHYQLFGFAPEHPGQGQWEWRDGNVVSSDFGSLEHQLQPQYGKHDQAFGLFQQIERMALSMQFEEDGLRVRSRWVLVEE